MPKESLENHLFRRGPHPLSWDTRIKVAISAATGLSFLHEAEEQEFNAKLSDLGLAKVGPTGDRTHVSTQVMGAQGYAAPEYVAIGRLTAKSDVYTVSGLFCLNCYQGAGQLTKTKSAWSKT